MAVLYDCLLFLYIIEVTQLVFLTKNIIVYKSFLYIVQRHLGYLNNIIIKWALDLEIYFQILIKGYLKEKKHLENKGTKAQKNKLIPPKSSVIGL